MVRGSLQDRLIHDHHQPHHPPVPGPQPEHAGEQPQLVVELLLAGLLGREGVEPAGAGGVLPGPLEPEGGLEGQVGKVAGRKTRARGEPEGRDVVRESVDHQHHVPGTLVAGPPGAPSHLGDHGGGRGDNWDGHDGVIVTYLAVVVLEYPPVRVRGLADISPSNSSMYLYSISQNTLA